MAFAFLAFGLWLRLARLGRLRLRAALFVPISMLIWVTHTFGWGMLGVMAFSAEFVRQHDRGNNLIAAGWRSALHCLALAPPLLLLFACPSRHTAGQPEYWVNCRPTFFWISLSLRDLWAFSYM